MLKAENLENYFKIPADTRDLNYDKFFSEGTTSLKEIEDYNSNNTTRLDVQGMKELLLKLDIVQKDL